MSFLGGLLHLRRTEIECRPFLEVIDFKTEISDMPGKGVIVVKFYVRFTLNPPLPGNTQHVIFSASQLPG